MFLEKFGDFSIFFMEGFFMVFHNGKFLGDFDSLDDAREDAWIRDESSNLEDFRFPSFDW
jgi:hypothetical protein